MKRNAALMTVCDVMTRAPIAVMPEMSVADLMQLFDRHDFNAFPVVNADGTLAGIVTKLDVLRLFRPDVGFHMPDASVVSSVPVRDIMRRGVVNVEEEEPLSTATELMVSTRLRSLPVIRRGSRGPQLVGIVTQGDLMRGFRIESSQPVPAGAKEGS